MTSKSLIETFLSQSTLAIVGVSRNDKKFGNVIFRELSAKGYKILPVNPKADRIGEELCYPSLKALPEPVDGLIIVVPPAQTEQVVQDAAAAGIKRVWMQQGSQSKISVEFCEENGISVVAGECILMFAEPTAFFHRLHRSIWKLIGKLPK
jgi:predicted CoA-binding protein